MGLKIYQGNDLQLEPSVITIVIDVIRAFTVAHYAFINGARKIFLVSTVEEAFRMKERFPDYLLAGEVKGFPIPGFDLDNSPTRVSSSDVKEKILVQKTTNGVKATLNSLGSEHLFVTGFSNAKTTALYIKKLIQHSKDLTINIIASHPTGDDDLACAQYIKGLIDGTELLTKKDVIDRIGKSHVAEKFLDKNQPEFDPIDLTYCVTELEGDFVMKVNKEQEVPVIERVPI
jgi:2-phosphosulfolactate phosphatase